MIYYLLAVLILLTTCGSENKRAREAWGCMTEGIDCRDERPSPTPTGSSPTPTPSAARCTVKEISEGAEIKCEDGQSVIILHGKDGKNPRPSDYEIVDTINPCGVESQLDEVLLRMRRGTVLAHYSSGGKQFLTEVPPGSYVTTDGTACHFTVDDQLTVIDEDGTKWYNPPVPSPTPSPGGM